MASGPRARDALRCKKWIVVAVRSRRYGGMIARPCVAPAVGTRASGDPHGDNDA
jgi:hypothetical protein